MKNHKLSSAGKAGMMIHATVNLNKNDRALKRMAHRKLERAERQLVGARQPHVYVARPWPQLLALAIGAIATAWTSLFLYLRGEAPRL